MRISSRIGAFIAISLTLLLVEGVAQNKAARPERELFDATNRERVAHGLPALQWNDALADAARKHASEMAQKKALAHQFPGEPSLPSRVKLAGGRFVWLSENVASGASASLIHAEFLKSTNHRANILDRDMDSTGIGIADRNGQLFAVEDFSKAK
jgi:uncharacterized protein YkwD